MNSRPGIAPRGKWYDDATAAAKERGWVNAAHQGAFRKGWLARVSGRPRRSPYIDYRTGHNNGVTFSRSFATAWEEGWDGAE